MSAKQAHSFANADARAAFCTSTSYGQKEPAQKSIGRSCAKIHWAKLLISCSELKLMSTKQVVVMDHIRKLKQNKLS